MSKIYLFVFFIVANCNIALAANSEENIQSNLQKYAWFEDVKQYESNYDKNTVDYHTKAKIMLYLERVGLYDTRITSGNDTISILDCFDQDSRETEEYAQFVKKEDARFLTALKTPEIQNRLSQVSAYEIINGPNEVVLKAKEKELQEVQFICSHMTKDESCNDVDTIHEISAMKTLPRSHINS
jgi:hypothetical protein